VYLYWPPATWCAFDRSPFEFEESIVVGRGLDHLVVPLESNPGKRKRFYEIQFRDGIDIAEDAERVGPLLFPRTPFHLAVNNKTLLMAVAIEDFYNYIMINSSSHARIQNLEADQ
jgi:hypothetical protein